MNIPAPCLVKRTVALFEKIPYSLIAFIARFSIAAVFWKSGQTKVEGFAIDAAGTGWVVTDNDGVADSSGETLFWSIGTVN